MALSMHLYTISTQVPGVKESIPYATAVVLLGSVLLVNAAAIALRAYMRSRVKLVNPAMSQDKHIEVQDLRLAYGTKEVSTESPSTFTAMKSSA